jgi:hypothetical protein
MNEQVPELGTLMINRRLKFAFGKLPLGGALLIRLDQEGSSRFICPNRTIKRRKNNNDTRACLSSKEMKAVGGIRRRFLVASRMKVNKLKSSIRDDWTVDHPAGITDEEASSDR